MTTLRTCALAGALLATLAGCAQPPVMTGHDSRRCAYAPGMANGMSHDHMAMMDAHMKKMREMQARMSGARTPEERHALMPEHMKLMQEGMAMMGGTGHGSMGGGGKGAHHGMGAHSGTCAPMDMHAHHQTMEKHMEMMRSVMQMMMDRMPGTPPAR